MNSREAILGALTVQPLPPAPSAPAGRGSAGSFEEAFVAVGGDILTPDELAGLRGATAFAEDDVPKSALEGFVATDNVWSAEIGFSMAVGAIAETGSLILVAGPGKPRLASLAPPHNIIVLRRSVIVETAEDAFANLPRETTVVVTGPSRTADIEGTLVRGIHGPKRLSVLLLD